MKVDIERLEIAELKPGDSIFITVKNPASMDYLHFIRKVFRRNFPENTVVVIDANTIEIKVVRGL